MAPARRRRLDPSLRPDARDHAFDSAPAPRLPVLNRLRRRIARFAGELKRRHVLRVGVAYGAVAWAVAGFADITFPIFGFPEWTVALVLVLCLLGFPIAIAVAWAFDVTPGGIVRTPSREEGEPRGEERAAPLRRRSDLTAPAIAALPLINLGDPGEDEIFSDGLTEELTAALAGIRGLRVTGRTSAFAFKGKPVDAREIGDALGVDYLLEGTVRHSADRIRLTARLLGTQDGFQLWSQVYDREVSDVFAVQREIAEAVAAALPIVTPLEATARSSPTRDPEARALYLRGRHFWNRRTAESLREAIDYFERAVAIDPAYAAAHAGLADAHSLLVDYGLVAPAETLAVVESEAERALELDPGLAKAHVSLALARQFQWRWEEAEKELRRSSELDAEYAPARQRLALLLAWRGRAAESIAEAERALALEPLSLAVGVTYAWALYYARRYADAEAAARSTLELGPDFANAHLVLGLSRARGSGPAEGLPALREALRLADGSPVVAASVAHAEGEAGDAASARARFAELLRAAEGSYVPAYTLAVGALGAGEREEALRRLEAAVAEGSVHLAHLGVEPLWDPLRDDARFAAVLERVGVS